MQGQAAVAAAREEPGAAAAAAAPALEDTALPPIYTQLQVGGTVFPGLQLRHARNRGYHIATGGWVNAGSTLLQVSMPLGAVAARGRRGQRRLRSGCGRRWRVTACMGMALGPGKRPMGWPWHRKAVVRPLRQGRASARRGAERLASWLRWVT